MSQHSHTKHSHKASHDSAPHGSLSGYLTGFGLSVVLTAIPFYLVMSGILGNPVATALTIMAFAVVQMVVHMVYFLHMHPKSEGGWTLMALAFTLIVVVIAMSGSMWVMYHLNTNMMPAHNMSDMPITPQTEAMDPTQPLITPQQEIVSPTETISPTNTVSPTAN